MKKYLIALMFFVSTAVSSEQLTGVWAFNISNVQGTYFREILNEANKLQSTYKFVSEHKPGAGGAVAAQYVKSKDTALLGTAAGYFVRPYLYPDTDYTFNDFQPVFVMALSPVALVSRSAPLVDILKKPRISIGTAGAGSLTHLLALKFKDAHSDKDIQVIPYKSSTEALSDVFGGHIDLAFEFLGDAEAKGATVLGTTGTNRLRNYSKLSDLGYLELGAISGVYMVLAKSSMPRSKVQELRSIFAAAEKAESVQALYRADCSYKPQTISTQADYENWYSSQIDTFRKFTQTVKVD